jgi:spore maturation protein CgeB
MKIFVFGSSITSSYWNGAATYYRGIYKELHRRGHEITFAEPDAYGRQERRDAVDCSFVTSIVYQTEQDLSGLLAEAAGCDLVIKHSGVGVFDELLDQRVLECESSRSQIAFWDVDAPATLARVEADPGDLFRRHIPAYDFVFTYGGGPEVVDRYCRLGAANCYPIYNALDPETHYPVAADPAIECDLIFIGNRLPDRERRVEEFFLRPAELAPELQFGLGGEGWAGKLLPNNVRWLGHIATSDHNRLNCSARMVLNVNRESMAAVGFSPPTRVFEAAGAGACLITDQWPGIEEFFTPGREILIAESGEDVVNHLRRFSREEAEEIGASMRRRALAGHCYRLRVRQVEAVLTRASSQPVKERS